MLRKRISSKQVALGAALAAAVAVGGFTAGRAFFGSDEAAVASPGVAPSGSADVTPLPTPQPADPIDTSRPGWGLPYIEADRALPRYDQVINGIKVGPTAYPDLGEWCAHGQATSVDQGEAAGTPLALPERLPVSGVPAHARAVRCGTIVSSEVTIEILREPNARPEMAAGKSWFEVEHGGQIVILKQLVAAPGFASQVAAERWEPATVNGLPAALGRAILRDEFGESAVVVWDERRSLQVAVRGTDIHVDDLLAVAREALQ
ncbi:MAG: hypothetical protein K6U88_06800 [Dehalococcoidia bacterium]|nr:hypothetical protein [Dehalococcoidia bacterium]